LHRETLKAFSTQKSSIKWWEVLFGQIMLRQSASVQPLFALAASGPPPSASSISVDQNNNLKPLTWHVKVLSPTLMLKPL
jgi:hypothetical protein